MKNILNKYLINTCIVLKILILYYEKIFIKSLEI
jgi:hypothetical protein